MELVSFILQQIRQKSTGFVQKSKGYTLKDRNLPNLNEKVPESR
jgi:hypothetical protein